MNKEMVEKVYKEIEEGFIEKYGHGKLDPAKMANLKRMLELLPHEDGCQRVTDMETGLTHIVPVKDIALHGLKGSRLSEYPIEK